jgi:hypothetical protein
MQFTIDVKEVDEGWEVNVLDPETSMPMRDPKTDEPILDVPRKLERLEIDEEIFPLPPANDPDGLPVEIKQAELPDAYRRLMSQSSGESGVMHFGRYLFNTLLGRDLWVRINKAAGPEPVELSLTWPAEDLVLNRLPWEVLHHGGVDPQFIYEGFLAADPDVALIRRVAGTREPGQKVDVLPSPPRVLFVVGASLTDPAVRPGAEYLGLLWSLEKGNRYLNTRILLNATTDSLADAIKAYRPNVVHIICHGLIPQGGKPSLEFRSSTGSVDPDYVDAKRLILALKTDLDLPLPTVVVLNACLTATSDEVVVGRPLAAELVQLGVPIVVGMSGRVADQACRLFTRGFYHALLNGGEIALAAARGRRAAIAHGGYDPNTSVDWALPVLFLSETVGEARLNIDVDHDEAARLRQAQEFSKRPDYPAFCDRWDFFQLYDSLMCGNQHQFLAVSVAVPDSTNPAIPQPQYGRTRLLKELAAQAVRDGHIPILVTKDWLKKKDWPGAFEQFLDLIAGAVNNTVQIFSGISQHKTLPNDWDWHCLPAFRANFPDDPPPNNLPAEFSKFGVTPIQKLAKAFMLDLLDLRRVVCVQRGLDEEADVRLLLLIDDFHQLVYSDELITLLDKYGLRDPRAVQKIRCVITYSSKPVNGQEDTVDDIKDWANSHDVHHRPLHPLHESINPERPLEDRNNFQQAALVYKHFLLHWRFEEQKKPLSISWQDEDPAVQAFITGLALTAKGLPSNLCEKDVTSLIYYKAFIEPEKDRFLRAADDDDALADLVNTLRKRK